VHSIWVNLRPALLIARRETRDQLRDWRIIFPVLALTVFFPFLMNFTASQVMGFVQNYGANIIGDRLIPFLLMIVGFFPISVSLVIALESFVGEKERGSIEPLLNTPLKDWQLYLGKLISSTVPPLLSSFLGMSIYVVGLFWQGLHLPEPVVLVQIVALTVVQAVLMVSGAVVVSTQATSVRAANLLASFIVIPIALLIQVESLVMFWGDYLILWLLVFGLVVLTFLLIRVGLAHFQREELLGHEIDVLNIRWGWGVFRRSFVGEAHSIKDWYLRVLPEAIRRVTLPAFLVFLIIVVSVWIGTTQVDRFPGVNRETGMVSADQLKSLMDTWPIFSFSPVLIIWWQNVRALLLAVVMGLFSFGVMGMMPAIITFGLLGFLMGVMARNGLPPWQYLSGLILPHGIIEIPAVILACAAVLRMGAILATPTPGKTIGEVWLLCLADWAKIMIGAVIPMLLVAAAIEAWVTPRIAFWIMGL
jgi:uncharacterized membrane protein SpoIIM required for sporulation